MDSDIMLLKKKLISEVVHSEQEAHAAYYHYGIVSGFKVCRGKQSYFTGTKTIRSKIYYCSNKNPTTRTGCGALVSFTVDAFGKWSVSKFVEAHNHVLAPLSTNPLPDVAATESLAPSTSYAASFRADHRPQPTEIASSQVISPGQTPTGRINKRKYSENILATIPTQSSLLRNVPNCTRSTCEAKRFHLEPRGFCCSNGKVSLVSHPMPTELRQLLIASSADATNFRNNIRTYNNNFAFTSLGVTYDRELTKNLRGMYTFRVQGQFHHFLPSLQSTGATTVGLQMYYYDSNTEIAERCPSNGKLLPSIANLIQKILADNPYTKFFKSLYTEPLPANCKILLNGSPLLDQQLYNLPTSEQIAAIISEPDDMLLDRTPHIQVQTTSGLPQIVKQTYGCCDPLQYPLLFPYGESGWHTSIPQIGTPPRTAANPLYYSNNPEGLHAIPNTVDSVPRADIARSPVVGTPSDLNSTSNEQTLLGDEDTASTSFRRIPIGLASIPDAETLLARENEASKPSPKHKGFVTARQFYCYKLQIRDADESILLHSLRLLQQFVVNAYVKIETQRLDYYRFWQPRFRTEIRAGVVDAVAAGDVLGANVGRNTILPTSFIGGPRDMRRRYFDAMALVQKYGKPDIFLTMTCNPKWPEIRANLKWHETPFDRPDILSRVFRAKLEIFKEEILKKQLFGEVESYVYVVEFQKTGMPHAHFLVILKNKYKPATPEAYDRIVCAEIPDENEFPHLHRLVIKHMIHGPCGRLNKDYICMHDGVCKDKYPKPFTDYTTHAEDTYPTYRRRNNGQKVMVNGKELDNRWIVPYNPHLLAMFDCHLNVEICSNVKLVKYMYKYVYKGLAMVNFSVAASDSGQPIDEIRNYQDARWLGHPEATWRIYKFPLSEMTPSVYTLQIHLEGKQIVTFCRSTNLQRLVDDPNSSKTMLTEFFNKNASDAHTRGLQLLYKDFPQFFVWNKKTLNWTRRKRGRVIGRPVTVNPKEGERYYLRLLLSNVKAPSSFQSLRTVNNQVFPTFRDAALQLGLLYSDKYVEETMVEASLVHMPGALRYLFATTLVFCNPDNPPKLFTLFLESMSADFRHELSTTNPSDEYLRLKTLEAIDFSLQKMGRSIQEFINLPSTDNITVEFPNTREIEFEHNINVSEEERNLYLHLNDSQKHAYDLIMAATISSSGESFFVDGPGGAGKTYLYKSLLATLRSEKHIALAVATSGVAASILPGGRTAHSRFGIPIDFSKIKNCTISKQSATAKLIAQAKLIIWDEAATANKEALEAFDHLLKDIMSNDAPLGGKTVVFGGDFRQTLPVLTNATRNTLINHSILGTTLCRDGN